MSQPRRLLIGSYFGDKILLATELVRWYLDHGLHITHIYQFIEYEPKACFVPFCNEVSMARRNGDMSPEKAILADTYKLLGNSSYGKTLENVANYRKIAYCDGNETRDLINEPSFVGSTQLSDDLFEVTSKRKQIVCKLSNQIGFVVYQNAKFTRISRLARCKMSSSLNNLLVELTLTLKYMKTKYLPINSIEILCLTSTGNEEFIMMEFQPVPC
uniref:uncharacterized protein LOC120341457 n=1 Tax=Styela clava TaxID=7725 RepID=UPI0019398A1F|nr:uncharacterized protein LOC120341457 [Styela clava]